MELKNELDVSTLTNGLRKGVDAIAFHPMILVVVGALMIAFAAISLFGSSAGTRDSEMALEQGKRAVAQLSEPVQALTRLLRDEQVQSLAALSMQNEETRSDLEAYLKGRVKEIQDLRLFGTDFILQDAADLGEAGFVLLDILLSTGENGLAPVQLVRRGEETELTTATIIGEPGAPQGYLVVTADAGMVLDAFEFPLPEAGYIALVQGVAGSAQVTFREFGSPNTEKFMLVRLTVPGSLLRVAIPQAAEATGLSNFQRLIIFIIGGLLLAFGLIRRQVIRRSPVDLRPDEFPDADAGEARAERPPDPGRLQADPPEQSGEGRPGGAAPQLPGAGSEDPEPGGRPAILGGVAGREAGGAIAPGDEPDLAELHYELEQRQLHRRVEAPPVDLSPDIFRAYDIRGIVGETLDAGVARQVGQAIGSLALEREAGPVVVGRDGRHSGPDLVDGMVEGLQAAGCDVIDVGAVPTGALYFAAYELGSGSGVMVTGSHNPPDYNGIKAMIGGTTLAGADITGLYESIAKGDLRVGKGDVRGEEVLDRYRERISGDIQLARPLKVVADCGNGIGGICAADILRAIGAEVIPLFDDVDGDFPNHHPDPSEPENLEDLIHSVQVMEADLGVAFDGDADRLGVVTPSGKIVYSDRVMMLFAREVLSRQPGKTVIYDVKCTGHLADVIRQAGGEAEMWKTGHSLIKNRMKEIGSPFAGEMSGHFFFEDRWYGFDCGIYAAARLLEILAADERDAEDVLAALPDSVSTPELKVHMQEGENHAFIDEFRGQAEFPGATITTIDGLRADFEGGWGLVRASNTTPVLVLRFDADDEQTLEEVQAAFRAQLLAVREDLELPF